MTSSTCRPRAFSSLSGVVLLTVALVSLTGCSKFSEPFKDAPVSSRNDDPAQIFTMPDGFSNVATKCGTPGQRVYVIFTAGRSPGAIAVVADPKCP